MRWRWLASVVASFVLCAYLGVWLCGLFYAPVTLPGDPLLEPKLMSTASAMPSGVADVQSAPTADLMEKVGFELSSTTTDPGEYLVLTLYGAPEDAELTIENPFGASPHFFKVEEHQAALLPVRYTVAPGTYVLKASGGGFAEEFTITVKEKKFANQNLVVDKSVADATVNNDAANQEYSKKVQAVKNRAAVSPLWTGAFEVPIRATYRVTTQFGQTRTVNGVVGDRHGGVDLAAPRGTPVYAANGGTVLFGEYIALTGNTVMIEHGLGLKTLYYHMDSLTVKTGDTVAKGQQIGTVGSTGFSTGPHLHFSAAIHDAYINPWTLMQAAPAV